MPKNVTAWALALCLMSSLSCGYGRKDTAKVVDPVLTGQGTSYERKGTLGGFRLGPYAIRKKSLSREPLSEVGAITPNGVPRPGERVLLTTELSSPARGVTWIATCEGLRKPTLEAEYASVLDEARDAVQIACEIADGEGAIWSFSAKGLLSGNFGGTITPRSGSHQTQSLDVEILLYRQRFDTVKRHLAEPVAQVRMGRNPLSAMVLSQPEQAWVAPEAPPELIEVSLMVLASLDLMPLGFEG